MTGPRARIQRAKRQRTLKPYPALRRMMSIASPKPGLGADSDRERLAKRRVELDYQREAIAPALASKWGKEPKETIYAHRAVESYQQYRFEGAEMKYSRPERDIDQALDQSFPASDPPPWTLGEMPGDRLPDAGSPEKDGDDDAGPEENGRE